MDPAFASVRSDWPASRVLYEDDDVIVVDKPAGMPTQAPEVRGAGDVHRRVRAMLAARAGLRDEDTYVGVIHRLERDVSGALVLSKRREANAALAEQLERGEWSWTYIAMTPRSVEPSRTRGWRALPGAHEDRRLVRSPTSQRPAAVRAELSGRDADRPGARRGDAVPDEIALRIASVSLRHPRTGDRLDVSTATAVRQTDRDALVAPAEILRRSADRRWVLSREDDVTALRWINAAGDGATGVTVDLYGPWALVQYYSPPTADDIAAWCDALQAFGARGVYTKVRAKDARILSPDATESLAPSHASAGDDAPTEFEISEHGLRFGVRLGDGMSTGIFLDQRRNRVDVRAVAGGRSVLNLFSYTAAFTVAAGLGGARHSFSVDASAHASERARDNVRRNGLDDGVHELVTADVFVWLKGARARPDRFDLVVVDPPSFSTTRDGSRFRAIDDYAELLTDVFAVTAPGGRVLACSNHRGLAPRRFHAMIREAATRARAPVRTIRDAPDPEDFPAPPGEPCHLKSVWIEM